MNEIEQAVLDAYASIGRQGTGTATNQIDPQGYAYWANKAAQEKLSPEQLKTLFNAEVGNYFQQKPTDPYTNYVSDYLVRDAYSNIGRSGLGDQPSNIDPEGYNFWINKTINEGLTPDQLSRQFGAEVTRRLQNATVQTQPTVEQYVSNYLRDRSAPFVTPPAQASGLRNLGVFGAAGNQMTGAGNAPYQSELIRSLRESNQQRLSSNPGVTMFATSGGNTAPVQFTRPSGQMAFNPPRLTNQNASGSAGATAGTTSGTTNRSSGTTTGTIRGNNTVFNSFGGNQIGSNSGAIGGYNVDATTDGDTTDTAAFPEDFGYVNPSDVPVEDRSVPSMSEWGAAAFPEDFGYVAPTDVQVVDRSVPSMSDANWGMASGSLLPDWAVDAAFGVKSATENPIVSTVFPIASAIGGSLSDATLDSQIDMLANQYAAIETGNNLGYGTRVADNGAVFYEAPVETRDIIGGSYFPQESYFNAYDFSNSFDGAGCPAPWVKIQMADGSTMQAGDLKPGMQVWTQHEHSGHWGAYPVTAVSIVDNNRQRLLFEDGREFVGSDNHRVKTGNGWTEIVDLKPGDKIAQEEGEAVVKELIELDAGPVVKITVQDAHTYVSEGFLSHNIKMDPFSGGGGGGVIGFGYLDRPMMLSNN